MGNSEGHVLVVDDDAAVGQVLTALLAQAGYQATYVERGESALVLVERKPVDLVITDVRMPGMGGLELLRALVDKQPGIPVVVLTAHGSVPMAVEAMKSGACDFLAKPFDREEILFVVGKALEGSRRARAAPPEPAVVSTHPALSALIGSSPQMEEVRTLIGRAAGTVATVLIRGETGTGKELAARAIHQLSPRAAGPFVRLNCGALPDSLLESELFGHERGAFTGAVQRKPGRVEIAQGGTLFLDEVGDVSPALQVKLLRLLQEREFERLGGTATLRADLRFVAATHQPLEELVRAGRFRADLLYRLNVVPLMMPSLRSRPGDIPELARHFHTQLTALHARRVDLSDDAVVALSNHSWPGNARQLQNLVERLVVLTDGDSVRAPAVARELARDDLGATDTQERASGLNDVRRRGEREAIVEALQRSGGNRTTAARLLGVSRRTLYNKLEALGLSS